jgi:hypothetical protein
VAVPAAFLLAVTLGPKPSPERYEPLDSPFDFDAFGGVVLVIDQLAQVVTFLAMVVAAGLVAAGAALALIGLALGTSALMGSVATQAFVALLPVAIGAAILRYRLFDLDRIISRTLAYGLLTVLLGSAYAAVVLGLGQLLPEDSSLVVAAATLTVAAVVGPARRRIQAAVDRRFNRRRHDAAQKIAAFSGPAAPADRPGHLDSRAAGGRRGDDAAGPGVAVAAAASSTVGCGRRRRGAAALLRIATRAPSDSQGWTPLAEACLIASASRPSARWRTISISPSSIV